jgi:four helix bundle protein
MNYKDLEVYKRSYRLALEIHNFSLTLPKYLQFDIADQIRRASRSIPSDIAEAYARSKSNKDRVNLLNDAAGSNEEMLFNLDFMRDVELITIEKYKSGLMNTLLMENNSFV